MNLNNNNNNEKGCETWTNDDALKNKVTFSKLTAIEFKSKIDCALPFLLPQVLATTTKLTTCSAFVFICVLFLFAYSTEYCVPYSSSSRT